ncbi:MAG: OB-fold domain-containing protein [Actinomycetota bacterium]
MGTASIPFVGYLALEPSPHLVAQECGTCGARYFDRRDVCASCEGTSFHPADVPAEGTVTAFTIVHLAAPGLPVPFVAATVDCGGTVVKGNIVDVPADPGHIAVGMAVRLVTVPCGVDDDGVEAISYGFEPVNEEATDGS